MNPAELGPYSAQHVAVAFKYFMQVGYRGIVRSELGASLQVAKK